MLRFPYILLLLTTITPGHTANDIPPEDPHFTAASWPEADRLFHSDPRWVGADDAYSIDLGGGRVLWLFGDTIIDPSGRRTRKGATFIRNSIGIQTGYDPSRATIDFHWRTGEDGNPASFFPEQAGDWFWPGHGIRLGDSLLLFMMRVRPTDTGFMFESYDWDAVLVSTPDADPSEWNLEWLEAPENDLGVIVGSGGILEQDGYVYAFSSREPVVPHPMYLVRWPVQKAKRGGLNRMEWWTGTETGWVRQADLTGEPQPVLENGQTELTVHYDEPSHTFLEVQTLGFGPAVVVFRSAERLTGPWTEPDTLYQPPEFSRPKVLIYAGKAHPHLSGADLVLTYATNTTDFSELFSDSLIYYPRFVRLTRKSGRP